VQLALAVADLAVEFVDQTEACFDGALPGLRQPELGEQLTATHAEQIGDGAGFAVSEQDGVHALFQARAVTDEMRTPACSLALSADEWVGQPDRRHQVAA